ncbi:MAG: hypothetical protein AB1921_04735 [Thermodesulfobacteriota bacterium]
MKTMIRYNAVYVLAALLLPDGAFAFLLGAGGFVAALFYYPMLPVVAAGAAYVAVRFRLDKTRTETEDVPTPESGASAPARQKDRRQVIQKDVVDFFFAVFSQQVGETTTSEISLLESRKERFTHVYEFISTHKGKKNTRRMSISNIGEDAAARSRCFYVIYNTHLVVKIPPVPVTDYSTYIREIQREAEMANILAPVECVVPKVSVIMRWLFPEKSSEQYSEAEQEDRYIHYAGMNPKVQAFLKIGSGFAFFMDLSTRFFLANVLSDLRDVKDRTKTELSACPEIVSNTDAFTGRYPDSEIQICFGVQTVYKLFEEKARPVIQGADRAVFKLPDFFMRSIAGNPPDEKEMGLDQKQMAEISRLARETMDENPAAVEAYRESIARHINTVVLIQNRPKIQSLILSCLRLLCTLGKKKVAARDLKPDNLFVTGDSAHYPAFLTDPGRFSLGLIDLETSLSYASATGRIIQPPLAGTPLYATQTHLFDNDLISALLGDLRLVLALQDWYAMVGICHLIATGEPLFSRTARTLAGVSKILQTSQATHDDPLHYARESSRAFWQSAVSEFNEKTRANRKILTSVRISMIGGPSAFFAPHFKDALAFYEKQLADRVASQQVFTDEKSRRVLSTASYETLLLQKRKIEQDSGQEKGGKAILLLSGLADLRFRITAYETTLAAFASKGAEVDAQSLLTSLFFRVAQAMYRSEWGEI